MEIKIIPGTREKRHIHPGTRIGEADDCIGVLHEKTGLISLHTPTGTFMFDAATTKVVQDDKKANGSRLVYSNGNSAPLEMSVKNAEAMLKRANDILAQPSGADARANLTRGAQAAPQKTL